MLGYRASTSNRIFFDARFAAVLGVSSTTRIATAPESPGTPSSVATLATLASVEPGGLKLLNSLPR